MALDQGSVTLVAAGSGIAGVVQGHYLTRSWQREQWLLDRRREEYRELISALSTVFTNMQRFGTGLGDKEFFFKLAQTNTDAFRVIRDRIIIGPEIADAKILERWHQAFDKVEQGSHAKWHEFADEYTELMTQLVAMALSPPPSRWRRGARLVGNALRSWVEFLHANGF